MRPVLRVLGLALVVVGVVLLFAAGPGFIVLLLGVVLLVVGLVA